MECESHDSKDVIQLWINPTDLGDPFLRTLSLPLTAIMYTAEDFFLVHDVYTTERIRSLDC